ncbi:MAG: helix-turn-helix domain-containing protein [Bacteroidia bacterium]|nr:helix-turn-helix domain-containing protein [Bacteroidia bacterium]
MIYLNNIQDFNSLFHQKSIHPLMGVSHLKGTEIPLNDTINTRMYLVLMTSGDPGMVITAKPGQTFRLDSVLSVPDECWVLGFCPEMVNGTGLSRDFYMFNFFDYEVMEPLMIDSVEHNVLGNCFQNILAELNAPDDDLTSHMLRLGIGQLLSYCRRFYDRQYGNKRLLTSEFINRLDTVINGYLADATDLKYRLGPPSVAWCSSQFHLTPNYFGDLVRMKLGISAREYIRNKVFEAACSLLADPANSVGDVAFQLGFNYPNHFTRFFKGVTGKSPSEYRHSQIIMA